MDWPLVLFLAVVAFFAYRGYKNGLLRSLSRILSLLAGYSASILFTEQVSAILVSRFQLEGLVSFIAAALGLFVAAAIAVIIVFWIVRQLMPARETPSVASSCGGLAIGLMAGVIVAIIAVWSFTFVRDFRSAPEHAQTGKKNFETFSNRVAGKAVTAAMTLASVNPEVARLSTAIIETPAEVSQHAQRLMSSDDLRALLTDPKSQAVLDSGDANALRQLPAFQQLIKNPDFLALAKSAGMLTDTAQNKMSSEARLATQLTEIWGRVQRVKNDARVQEILSDPEFQQKVRSGNPLDMLTNPRLLELANIIFSNPAPPDSAVSEDSGDTQFESNLSKPPAKTTRIYSWTDENGQIHVSDIKPES
jgi:hypothetical protein